MISVDTNILLHGCLPSSQDYPRADEFLSSLEQRDDVAISEFFLLELYILVRNPAIIQPPMPAEHAWQLCQAYRQHPRWQIVGFSLNSQALHDRLWSKLRSPNFPRRRAYDLRAAYTLQEAGVTEFATANVKDFRDAGFARVWNPLLPASAA